MPNLYYKAAFEVIQLSSQADDIISMAVQWQKLMKMNLFGYTYKIYDIGYKTEMMSKECNAGDPLETPGGLYRGPPSNGLYNI